MLSSTRCAFALIVQLAVLSSLMAVPTAGFDVTNEQLRGAMLTLVSSYNTLENNLERHEIRERALGEVIKKGLQTLHKGQRIFEPMRGTFSRLDERISQMETLLIGRDTELKEQQAQTGTALDRILEWIESRERLAAVEQEQRDKQYEALLAAVNKPDQKARKSTARGGDESTDDDDDDDDVGKKVDDLADSVKRLRQEVAETLADRSHADATIRDLLQETRLLIGERVTTAVEVIDKLEQNLSTLYVTGPVGSTTPTPVPVPQNNAAFETSVQTALQSIDAQLHELQLAKSAAAADSATAARLDRDFFAGLANETLEAITDMRIEVLTASDKSFAKTATRIKEATVTLDAAIGEAVRTIGESGAGSVVSTTPSADVDAYAERFEQLREDIAGLRQLEKILVDTGDNVLAVKRGMEYNVHAVQLGVGDLIKAQIGGINDTLTVQFGMLNATIYANHNVALANLTSKIETEISQVWRQIGIMFQMMQTTGISLQQLQEQTEVYVNGSSAVMSGMGGKVSQITERMVEVDGNLNYLLGRLSLITQEFNHIKTGLGAALDDIKNSFQSVQKQIQDVGPGPHQINENDTEYNLVNDQPAAPAAA